MENATKALLIAASVLIVIALIAMALGFLNSTSNVRDQTLASASTVEASMYNSQFLQYAGEQKKGRDVISLLRKVIQMQSTNTTKGTINVYEIYKGGSPISNLESFVRTIDKNGEYKIECDIEALADGSYDVYINSITITPIP